jgi:hypothetical protein
MDKVCVYSGGLTSNAYGQDGSTVIEILPTPVGPYCVLGVLMRNSIPDDVGWITQCIRYGAEVEPSARIGRIGRYADTEHSEHSVSASDEQISKFWEKAKSILEVKV